MSVLCVHINNLGVGRIWVTMHPSISLCSLIKNSKAIMVEIQMKIFLTTLKIIWIKILNGSEKLKVVLINLSVIIYNLSDKTLN